MKSLVKLYYNNGSESWPYILLVLYIQYQYTVSLVKHSIQQKVELFLVGFGTEPEPRHSFARNQSWAEQHQTNAPSSASIIKWKYSFLMVYYQLYYLINFRFHCTVFNSHMFNAPRFNSEKDVSLHFVYFKWGQYTCSAPERLTAFCAHTFLVLSQQ
jgi:hypothetical protein